MAAITWDSVVDFAPGLSTFPADGQDAILEEVGSCFNAANFVDGEASPKLRLCRIYYAAHLATMASQGASGAAGPIVMEMIDRMQRSYATPSGGVIFDGLDGTSFGKMLRALVRTTAARAPRVL
jgi:hypothetical protein